MSQPIDLPPSDGEFVPTTFDHCDHVTGPFFHGTKALVEPGELLVAGHESNFQSGRISNNIYFSAVVDIAALGAQLACALAGSTEPGHVYRVEPTGPFEDDPNVTNKRFPGNPTRSYRSPHPVKVVERLDGWTQHPPERITAMLTHLEELREQGLDVIED